MENYLLDVDVLQRTLDKQIAARNKRVGTSVTASKSVEQYLLEITDKERIDAQSQYLAKKIAFHKGSHIDHSTILGNQASRRAARSITQELCRGNALFLRRVTRARFRPAPARADG